MNPATAKCVDLHAPCEDGSETSGCARKKGKDLEKGTNLQTWECHGEENQEWTYLDNGRLQNPVTGLCIDIKAPCKDPEQDDDPKCERVAVGDLKDKANIQMWTCHEDDPEDGEKSASYGNQKWVVTEDGMLKNTGSGLCLVTVDTDKETNVQVGKCGDYPGHQLFVMVPPKFASSAGEWAQGLEASDGDDDAAEGDDDAADGDDDAADGDVDAADGDEDAADDAQEFEILADRGFLKSRAAFSPLSAALVCSAAVAMVGASVWIRRPQTLEQHAAE